jgi:DmsE family decaheme c-type cytochrome
MKARGLLVLLALLAPSGLEAADYVGSNVCRTCHGSVYSSFSKNRHYRIAVSDDQAPGDPGCESCHGPGRAHVEAGGGKTNLVAFSELSPSKIQEACLRCHGQTILSVNIRRSEHTLDDVVCTSCHSIHQSKTPKFLLARQQSELCYSCHSSVRAEFSLPFKHRVNEGSVQCSDCHDPHGSFAATWNVAARPRMAAQAEGNEEPCLKCHIDKRGPFLYEHEGVRVEGCETCHDAHGSVNARLVKRPAVFTLCLECHNGFGVSAAQSSHNLADPRYQRCTSCHARIHGSNSSELFLR